MMALTRSPNSKGAAAGTGTRTSADPVVALTVPPTTRTVDVTATASGRLIDWSVTLWPAASCATVALSTERRASRCLSVAIANSGDPEATSEPAVTSSLLTTPITGARSLPSPPIPRAS